MNIFAIATKDLLVYWSSLIIVLGSLAGLMLSLALCHDKKCSKAAVFTFFCFAFVLSVLIARLMSWYFLAEQYSSLKAAMTDFTSGTFCIMGVLFASLIAGAIVKLMKLASFKTLMDTVAPGIALSLAFLRLSAIFGNTCRSKIAIKLPFLQFLPFAYPSTDSAGNVNYYFAAFFVAFIFYAVICAISVRFYINSRDMHLTRGAGNSGNVANLTLVMCCLLELLIDSTRSDAIHLHFMLLTSINKYVGFMSVSMIIGAVCIVAVFVHYLVHGRRSGKTARNIWLVLGFILSFAGVGGTEYCAQRFTSLTTLWHFGQTAFALVMLLMVYLAYTGCQIVKHVIDFDNL